MFVAGDRARPAVASLRSCSVACMGFVALFHPERNGAEASAAEEVAKNAKPSRTVRGSRATRSRSRSRLAEIELCLGKQLSRLASGGSQGELAHRVGKMRKKFARHYGFVVPEIKLTDDLAISAEELPDQDSRHRRRGEETAPRRRARRHWATARMPDVPGEEVREPAFGMKAMWVSETVRQRDVKREGFKPVDNDVGAADPSERGDPQQPRRSSSPTRTCACLLDRLEPEYQAACSTRSALAASPIRACRPC